MEAWHDDWHRKHLSRHLHPFAMRDLTAMRRCRGFPTPQEAWLDQLVQEFIQSANRVLTRNLERLKRHRSSENNNNSLQICSLPRWGMSHNHWQDCHT